MARETATEGAEQSRCFDNFKMHRETLEAIRDANEATTRLRVIDTILFEVLAWEKTAVDAEKYCRTAGYADYAVRCSGRHALVIEAKREGVAFLLPDKQFSSDSIGFGLLASECPEAGDALRQAAAYVTTLGSRYVAITNGHQWILALSFVQDQPIEDRSVIVFESLEAIEARFGDFWRALSPSGICLNLAAERLLESRKRPAPKKLSSTIYNYPVPASRNPIANELSTVIDLVWAGMGKAEASPTFLKECYVIPGGSRDSLQLATELIAERRRSDEVSLTTAVPSTRVVEILRTSSPEKPIIVLGRVGHGKSTFLRYLRLIEAQEALTGYVQIDVDFLDRPDDADQVPSYVYDEIERQLRERQSIDISADSVVRGVLDSPIARFKRTPRGVAYAEESEEYKEAEISFIESITANKHEYLRYVIEHLQRGQGKSIAIFLDNLDRRQDSIQEEAFLKASAMSRDWSSLVFVCLRPSTFYRSRDQGVLDSLSPKVINVSSPDPAVMLKKRFGFAIRIARGEDLGIEIATGKVSRHTAFDLPTVAKFLECCLSSFWENRELVGLFEAASNGNPRDLLLLVSEVLSSHHLNTRKILKKLDSGYLIPVHEALRALLYGDSMHYSPKRSRFVNIYDIEHDDPKEHFGRLLLLSFLQRVQPGSASSGYVPISDIEKYLCHIGYSGTYARGVMRQMHESQCVEDRISGIPWEDELGALRLTSLGKYHISFLASQFQYVDAVVVDTPIVDAETRMRITDTKDITARLVRAQLFTDYLSKCSSHVQDSDARAIWSEIELKIRRDIEAVRFRAANSRSH